MLLMFLLLLGSVGAEASSSVMRSDPKGDYIILNEVKIEGNLKTNSRIILRELALHPGDTIFADKEEASLRKDRNKIINTNLFVTVDVVLQRMPGQQANLLIHVTERWYLFPVPIFELADRNFNEWWYERGRDLRRTQYGIRVSHKNFRGRNEQFNALVQLGFTRKFELSYDVPYLDKVQKMGLNIDLSFSENKSSAYQTIEHKLAYIKSEDIVRKRFHAGVGISRRNRFYMIHRAEFGYNYNQVIDTIALLNPNYYLNGNTRQRYFQLSYGFSRDLRDAVAYPLHGSRLTVDINKSGLLPSDDINQLDITASYTKYTPLGKHFYFNNRFQGKLSFPKYQAYANTRGLGYGQDFVRGYELYVIDGQSYLVSKSTLKKGLFKTQANVEKILPFKQFQTIPIALYINLYFDMGYVNNYTYNPENNFLSNKLLYGSGVGLDLVTFYNTVFRVDFSINKSLQKNIFFHFVKDI
ncbi:MAG: BamA/TamA family outer membrane protein [Bacteroidota bacterium]